MHVIMNLRYHIPKSWTPSPALTVAKKIERSGKNNFAKRSNKERNKISANNVNSSRKLPKKLMKKSLKKQHLMPNLIMPTINNTITSMEVIMDTISSNSLSTPPTKAVGDQHRPHLNTLLEERSHKCHSICNRLKLMLKIRLKFMLMTTLLRFSRKNYSRSHSLLSRGGMKKIKKRYSKYTG
jgi:hypothetical protein